MLRRLLSLLVIAGVAGFGAGVVSNAQAVKPPAAARIPAIPAVDVSASTRCPIPLRFRTAFIEAATETHLPLALLTAVAQIESQFEPRARSVAGARGLLQVMPVTAAALELDAHHPEQNVLAGARYLRAQFDRFHSSDLALAAYNAGPSAVDGAGGAPSEETLTYVADVTAVWRALAGCG